MSHKDVAPIKITIDNGSGTERNRSQRIIHRVDEVVQHEKPYDGSLFTAEEAMHLMPEDDVTNTAMLYTLSRISSYTSKSNSLKYASQICQERCGLLKQGLSRKLSLDSVVLGKVIGSGGFGQVFKARYKNKDVAIKLIARTTYMYDIYKERDVMLKIQHHRVIKILGAFHDSNAYIMMELCKCSARKLIKVSQKNAVRYFVQLLQGLEYMHENGILHCDMKAENCLITFKNNLVISDFGSALVLDRDIKDSVQFVRANQLIGNACFADYEVNCRLYYSKANDIFAAACVLFEIKVGEPLMMYEMNPNANNDRQLYREVFEKGRINEDNARNRRLFLIGKRIPLQVRVEMADSFTDILKKMVVKSSANRPSATQLLKSSELKYLMFHAGVTFENLDSCGENDRVGQTYETEAKPERRSVMCVEDGLSLGFLYRDEEFKTPNNDGNQKSRERVVETKETSTQFSATNSGIGTKSTEERLTPKLNEIIDKEKNQSKPSREKLTGWLVKQPIIAKLEKELEDIHPLKRVEAENEIIKKLGEVMKGKEVQEAKSRREEATSSPIQIQTPPRSQAQDDSEDCINLPFNKKDFSNRLFQASIEPPSSPPTMLPSPDIIPIRTSMKKIKRSKKRQQQTQPYPVVGGKPKKLHEEFAKARKAMSHKRAELRYEIVKLRREDVDKDSVAIDELMRCDKTIEPTEKKKVHGDIRIEKSGKKVRGEAKKHVKEVCVETPETVKKLPNINVELDSHPIPFPPPPPPPTKPPSLPPLTPPHFLPRATPPPPPPPPTSSSHPPSHGPLPVMKEIEGKMPCPKCKVKFRTIPEVQDHMMKCYNWC